MTTPAAVTHGALALGILILASEDFDVPLVDLYTSMRAAIEGETALRVAPFDLFAESVRQSAIKACAGDGRCFIEKFRASGVEIDLLLTISAAHLDEKLLLGLRLADARNPMAEEIAARGIEIDRGASVSAALAQELSHLFPSDVWGQVAEIAIDVDPPGAEVRVEDRSCVAPCRIDRVAPGEYSIVVTKIGFEPWKGSAAPKAKEHASVAVRLIPIPPEPPSIVESPWFWGAIAAAALALGAGAYLVFRKRSDEADVVCIHSPPGC